MHFAISIHSISRNFPINTLYFPIKLENMKKNEIISNKNRKKKKKNLNQQNINRTQNHSKAQKSKNPDVQVLRLKFPFLCTFEQISISTQNSEQHSIG